MAAEFHTNNNNPGEKGSAMKITDVKVTVWEWNDIPPTSVSLIPSDFIAGNLCSVLAVH
jgi:hypothetical protein